MPKYKIPCDEFGKPVFTKGIVKQKSVKGWHIHALHIIVETKENIPILESKEAKKAGVEKLK